MNENRAKKSDMIDIPGLLRTYFSKWHYFVISVVICGGLAVMYAKISKPIYQVNANVLISQEEGGGVSSSLNNMTFGLFGNSGYVEDEVFVISSHSVFRDVVKELGLHKNRVVKSKLIGSDFMYKEYPVEVYCEPSIPDTLRVGIMFEIDVDDEGSVEITAEAKKKEIADVKAEKFPVTVKTIYGDFVFNKTEYFVPDENLSMTIAFSSYDAAAEALSEDVMIGIASKKSNVIALSLQHSDTDYAKDVLNGIIEKYNQRGIEEKNFKGKKTAEFIDSRLVLLSQDLESSESDIESYKKGHGIVDVTAEASYQINKKSGLEKELIAKETEFEILKMTREFISNPENAYSLIPTTSGSSSTHGAIGSYNNLILERMKLENNAKANNAALRALNEQIDAIRKNIITSLDRTYETSIVALNELRSEVNATERKLGNIPTQEKEFLNIKRQQKIKESLYLFLLQRREETALMLANSVPKGLVVDAAYTMEEPVSMSKKMIVLIAIMLGLCFPPVFLYLRKLLNTKFSTKEEVEKLTDIPVLGEICMSKSENRVVIQPGRSSSVSELFRLIRSNLQFILNNQRDKVVLMTSTVSGEGKSFISINLAASFAILGKRTLLVGMDIRSPKLAEYLGITTKRGLTEYLSSESVSLDSIINRDAVMDGLDIITAGPVPPNPSELLSSKRVDELFEALRGMYDFIVVDSAPVGMVSDTFTLSRISDATAYVCRANYTSIKDIDFVNGLYAENRLRQLALIVNGTEKKKGYGYGYGHQDSED